MMETLKENSQSYSLFALNIVKSLGKNIFCSDKALSLLTKSDSFFKELLNTFNGLYKYAITPEKFEQVIKSLDTSRIDESRLFCVAELYSAYVKTMEKNSYVLPGYSSVFKQDLICANKDIEKIRLLLKNLFNKKQPFKIEKEESKSVSYLEFTDVSQEAFYIADKIKELTQNPDVNYGDIAVFADKTETRDKICDILKTQNIPVLSSIYNEHYENLKHKLNIYQNISDVLLELNIQDFTYEEFQNSSPNSKALKEICIQKSDELFKDLLEEVLTDSYAVEKIVNAKEKLPESSPQKSILGAIHTGWNNLKEEDAKLLGREFGAIKSFYSFYKEGNYAQAADCVIKRFFPYFEKTPLMKILAGKIKSLYELQKLYDTVLNKKADFESFKDILKWLPKDTEKDKNAVYLASISADISSKTKFKYVFVAGLTENNYPGTNPSYPFVSIKTNEILTTQLKKLNPSYETFLITDGVFFKTRLDSLCNVMAAADVKITFSYHSYESKKNTQPSVAFSALKDFDSLNYKKITIEQNASQSLEKENKTSYEKNPDKQIISNGDILKLNASSINAFQKCPRKYYYKNLLNLKEPYTFAASYGTVVHAVFELLNTKYLKSFDKNTAIELSCILFDSKQNEENEQKALLAGFKQTDIDLVKAADDLAIAEMKENFSDAVDDFCMSGGFDSPCVKAECEKSFTFSLPQIPDVVFDGRIDAILIQNDGSIKIVDYKTGRDKANTLEYAISEYGVNFKLRTGKDPSDVTTLQNAYDYQIPLYYLASQNSPELSQYKDKISELSLVYIRPKAKDNGCNEDSVKADKIEFYKAKIIEILKETVIDKIKNETEFKKSSGWACENCAYKFLCDSEDETDD